MKIIIDRFEENIAIAEKEDEGMVSIPKEILDKNCAEGDIYEIVFLEKETLKRRKKLEKLKNTLLDKQ